MHRNRLIPSAALSAVLVMVVFLLAPLPAMAFQLTPMSAVLDPSGSLPTATFEISNSAATPVAVQLRAVTRSILPDGTELNEDASQQLQVFPSQVILRPGLSQTIRVRWVGGEPPTRELPFRLVAEQLPVNLQRNQEAGSGLQFMLRYRATLYVRPPGTTPRVEVERLEVDRQENVLILEVANRGTRHQPFSSGYLILTGDTPEQQVNLETLEPFVTVNVLPGERRRVVVPLELLPVIPREVRFRFDR